MVVKKTDIYTLKENYNFFAINLSLFSSYIVEGKIYVSPSKLSL